MVFCRIRPLERPRKAANQSHFYQPKANQRELEEELWPYKTLRAHPIEEPVIVDIICSFATVEGATPYPVAPLYGDEDNLRKAVNDALVAQEIIFNDRYVIGGETWKLFGESDCANIKIWRPA